MFWNLFDIISSTKICMKKFKMRTRVLLILVIVSSFSVSFAFPGIGDDPRVQNSITFIGILFGIIVGFFIADLYSRYQAIRDNAGTDSSCLSTFYFFAEILAKETGDKKWLKKVEDRIEQYIKTFMPLSWEQYSGTEKEFSELGKSLKEIQYKGDKSNETYSNILNVYNQHSTARENLVMFGTDKLSVGEWLITLFLGILLLASLLYVKDTSLVSNIFTGSILSAIIMLFIVLRDLNNLDIGESSVSVEPYERVLDAIGKPRCFADKKKK